MKAVFCFIAVVLTLAATLSCTAWGDPLIGEFSFKKNGPSEIKVTIKDGQYFVSMKSRNSWDKPERMQALAKNDLAELFGSKCSDAVFSGIGGGQGFMILHVKQGTSCDGVTFESDYLMKTLFGGGFLHKVK